MIWGSIPNYILADATRLRITNSITDLKMLNTAIPKLSRIYYFGTTIPTTEPGKNLFSEVAQNNTNTWLHRFYAPNVTHLPDRAFYSCSNLTSISFGKSLVCEGNEVFKDTGCERWQPKYNNNSGTNKVTEVVSDISDLSGIPAEDKAEITTLIITEATGLTKTDFAALGTELPELKEVMLSSITTIPAELSKNCTWLESFSAPDVVSVAVSAFNGCTTLTEVNLPSVTTLTSSGTFANCSSLVSVYLPELITLTGTTFQNCTSLKTLKLGASSAITCAKIGGSNITFATLNPSTIDLYLGTTEYNSGGNGNKTGTSWDNVTWKSISPY
jgi:hypothetical protein